MRDGQDSVVDLLRPRRRDDYLRSALPSPRDRNISALLDRVGTEAEIRRVAAQLVPLAETVLGVYAQRMAVLTVRKAEARHLRSGLRAACLASAVDDWREVIVVLGLLWRSAELIGRAPVDEFIATADAAGEYGEILRSFAARRPEHRSIAAMKYAERGEGEGFEYVSEW